MESVIPARFSSQGGALTTCYAPAEGGEVAGFDLLSPSSRPSAMAGKSINLENDGHGQEQIISFMKQAEADLPIKELCRQGSFSDAPLPQWRTKQGGMDAPDVERLHDLEAESNNLKKLLAEAHLDIHALKTAFRVRDSLTRQARCQRRHDRECDLREWRT